MCDGTQRTIVSGTQTNNRAYKQQCFHNNKKGIAFALRKLNLWDQNAGPKPKRMRLGMDCTRQPLESHEFQQSLGLSIPHQLQGLSISKGWFAIKIVWPARQIGKPYLFDINPTNLRLIQPHGIQGAGDRSIPSLFHSLSLLAHNFIWWKIVGEPMPFCLHYAKSCACFSSNVK
jgi:hypothetical protein